MDTAVKIPRVSVLMPVYNGRKYLAAAIESILNQTFRNFEFLIIDDGSSDRSAEIIQSYDDRRIKYISNDSNKGLPYSLNRGLQIARGTYIARMDCDDISLPDRLAAQVSFMDAHLDIGVCGTWVRTIGEPAGLVQKYLTDPEDILANLLFNTSLAHPSVMMRTSVLTEHHLRYDAENLHFEDYALWAEVSRYSRIANLPLVLLLYRLHASSVSHANKFEQAVGASHIRRSLLERLGMHPSEEDMGIHNSLRPAKGERTSEFIIAEEAWLMKILHANASTRTYNRAALSKIIYIRWRTVCGMNAAGGLLVWNKFVRSPLYYTYNHKTVLDTIKLFVKCLVRKQ